MKNTNILYGVIGLLLGLVIAIGFYPYMQRSEYKKGPMVHQMADGTLMSSGHGVDMNSMMTSMMAGLQGKTGDTFDKEFLAEMVVHHQGAVDMAKAVLATSKRPELLNLANDIISAQTKEISMMKEWQKAWFK
jgi:uncharacterized protein (DUF305 family)